MALASVTRFTCAKYFISNLRKFAPLKTQFSKFSALSPNPSLRHNVLKLTKTMKRDIRSSRRRSLSPVDEISGTPVRLMKPFAFTLLVSGCSFCGASVWQYENLRKVVTDYRKDRNNAHAHRFFAKAGSFRHHINLWWNSLSDGHKLVSGIIAVNVGVFLMWRLPAFQPFMLKYFSASPMSGAPCWSLFLSTFSHFSAFHLLANMYVLWSFSDPICNLLGKEQFLATYLTAGVVSGFASYALKVARMSPVPSLGASGAIMAILGMVCSQFPNAQLSIAFVGDIFPHSFSADSAMKALITFDTLGVIFKWHFFDHAAHLGGMLFGLWYIHFGHKYIWGSRESMLKWWHQFRGKP